MLRLIISALIMVLLCTAVYAEDEQLKAGDWRGTLVYSDGTSRSANYKVSVNENNETQIRVEDEEDNVFILKPVSVKKGIVSFPWNPKNERSKCTLTMQQDTDYYEGECQALENLSVTITMRPVPESPQITDN